MKRLARTAFAALVALGLAYVLAALALLCDARSTIDEGVYLNAGRLVFEGEWLYRDFPFSQGPVVPWLYGLATQLFGQDLLVGRAVSFVLGVAGVGAAAWIARLHAGTPGAAAALALSLVNLPALWVAATVRTQSLATPLVLLGTLALALPRTGAWSFALAPSLFVWATGARLTEGLSLLLVLAWVAWQLRAQPARLARVAAIVGAQAALAFLPMLATPRAAGFHVFVAQLGRGERGVGGGGAENAVLAKIAVLLSPETSFFPIVPLALAATLHLLWRARRGWRPDLANPLGDALSTQAALVVLALSSLVPHLLLGAGFLTYFVTPSVLLSVVAAIAVVRAARDAGTRRARVTVVGVAGAAWAAAAVVAPLQWHAWAGTGPSSPAHLREVAREIRALAGPTCTMLTMETTLAYQAGCRVTPGLEYSFFSYFAGRSDADSRAHGVLNTRRLRESVRRAPPELIALGPRGRAALRGALGPGNHARPPSLGRLAPEGYTFHEEVRITSGAHVRAAPEHVVVAVFVRDDLLPVGEQR